MCTMTKIIGTLYSAGSGGLSPKLAMGIAMAKATPKAILFDVWPYFFGHS